MINASGSQSTTPTAKICAETMLATLKKKRAKLPSHYERRNIEESMPLVSRKTIIWNTKMVLTPPPSGPKDEHQADEPPELE